MFELFWNAYPRHVSKGGARKAYAAAIGKTTPEQLLAGAKRYAGERTGQDPKFTKHPASWLNQECWADEPAPDPTMRLFEVHEGGAPRTDGRRLNQCDTKIANFFANCEKMGM